MTTPDTTQGDHPGQSGDRSATPEGFPLVRIAWLAIAYALIGKASLELAIPPGYATAIFPPSGLALAALLIWGWRCWPGVFLGSTLLNLWVALSGGGTLTGMGTLVAMGIAMGSSLQALVSAYLVRRFVGFPTPLAHEKQIIRFIFLSGPLSCLIAATVGAGVLWGSGTVPTAHLFSTWWTWWVGDTLGIILITVLIFCFVAEPKRIWRSRRVSVAVPLLVLMTLVTTLFFRVSDWENTRIRLTFENQADHLAYNLEVIFRGYLQSIQSIERFYASSTHVDPEEFRVFTSDTFKMFPGIQALEWIPRVRDEDRLAFEKKASSEGFPGFQIREQQAQGVMVPALKREEYFPVHYVEPLPGNEKAVGFDIASNPTRKAALDLARDSGQMVASGRITLVQENQKKHGFLVFQPIYTGESPPQSIDQRRKQLHGFALGVFRIEDMMRSALEELVREDIQIRFLDKSAPAASQDLLHEVGFEEPVAFDGFSFDHPFDMAGRQWVLQFSIDQRYTSRMSSDYPWLVMTGGLVVSGLFGIFLLILTGRTSRIAELVQERTAQLKDSESRTTAIVQSAVDCIITIDEFGLIESVNLAVCRLFGYTEKEMIGQNIKMLMPSPHHENHDLYLQRYRESGQARIVGLSREVEGLAADGTLIPLELSVSDIKLAQRRIFTGILHDLTERKKADKLKSEFVSTVSHELRTPLTSIQGSLGLIKGGVGGELPSKVTTLVEVAHRNCDRLVRLINDILDLEKIEAGKMTFKLEVLALSPLIHHALESNQAYGDKHGVSLTLQEDLTDAQVSVDEDRLAQVMANLLSNAVKFSPKGASVDIAIHREGGWVKVSVRDYGEGVPEAFQDKLFQKFSQADAGNTRKTGGTGLGLSISKVIVERMGGNIGFDTEPGRGTTFYFSLPEFCPPPSSGSHLSKPLTHPLARVLICEDEPDIARTLGMMLANDGYETDIAMSAAQARELLGKNSYQAMTLDLMLPDQNGLALLKELREAPATRNLPVVVVSAWVDQMKQEVNGNAINVTDWLVKPLDAGRLKQAIAHACGAHTAKRRILHIEDDHSLFEVVQSLLLTVGEVEGAFSLAEAREKLEAGPYDLILLDLTLPDGSGVELLPWLRDRFGETPVVIFSGSEVDSELAQTVSTTLVKSRTSNGTLLKTIEKWLQKKAPSSGNGDNTP
ncbi:MAG: CHASE domain-containing protein [Magnetococcales bacterium]|nr:CHASE domain-containing protein [Magnetococcales bacterium]